MGCGCQKNVAAATWSYTNAAGMKFGPMSQVQALAMKAKQGGQGTVTASR